MSLGDTSRKFGSEWRKLSAEEKEKFQAQANEYNAEMKKTIEKKLAEVLKSLEEHRKKDACDQDAQELQNLLEAEAFMKSKLKAGSSSEKKRKAKTSSAKPAKKRKTEPSPNVEVPSAKSAEPSNVE